MPVQGGSSNKTSSGFQSPNITKAGERVFGWNKVFRGHLAQALAAIPPPTQDTALRASHERCTKLRKMMQPSQAGEIRPIFLLAQISTSISSALQALDHTHYQKWKMCSCKTLQNQLHAWIFCSPSAAGGVLRVLPEVLRRKHPSHPRLRGTLATETLLAVHR